MKILQISFIFGILFALFQTILNAQNTYYSQGTNNWNVLTNWNTVAGGGGSNPVASELISTTNNFVVQAGHTVTVNDSLNINTLTVNGTLTIGNNTTARNPVVKTGITIGISGLMNTGAFSATHVLKVTGGFTNNGNIDFKNSSSQVVNLNLSGTQTVGGNGTNQFNNFEITSGTITAADSLNVDGSFIVNTGTTFTAGTLQHNFGGSVTVTGTFTSTNSTIVLDAPLVQNVTNNTTFNNLIVKSGGVKVFVGNITVNGDFTLTENTTVNTTSNNTFYKNFTVDNGSLYNATDGEARFYGTTAQAISVGSANATFDRVLFQGAGLKTIDGNLIAADYSTISSGATIEDVGDSWSHSFANGLIVDGNCNFSGTITLKGGNYRKGGTDASSPSSFFLGNGADVVIDGYNWLIGGDTMKITGNFTINSGYMVIQTAVFGAPYNTTIDGEIIGQAGSIFTVNAGTLYIRGLDNFPAGFDSYTFSSTSSTRYDASINQVVRGNIAYGNLQIYDKIKTVDGPLTIKDYLYVQAPDADSVHLDLGAFDHTIAGYIYDNYDVTRPLRKSNIVSTGTVTMNGADVNQYIYARTNGKYEFNNLVFTNSAPTAVRYKIIQGNIFVNNNFSITNSTANELLYLVFDIDDYTITGGTQFTLGENVECRTSGAINFKTTVESFTTNSIHENSSVRFDGVNQTIPDGITYGNIYLYNTGIKTMEGNLVLKGEINDVGYTPVLTNAIVGSNINIEGDWLLETAYVNLDATSSVVFDGENQIINATTLPNVVLSGSGTKTLNGSIIINGSISIYNGVEFDADNQYITLYGNWDNNSTGTFHQLFGRTTFVGNSGQTIEVLNPATSKFYDLYIDKPTGDTLSILSDVTVSRNFRFTSNRGDLNIKEHTLTIGGDWYIYDGCSLIYDDGAKIVFNGNDTEQLMRNYNASTIYPDLEFSGSAMKRLYDNTYDINGDFYINHSTVSGEYFDLRISGDWKNSGGTFNHYRTVFFDGADQFIEGSNFNHVVFDGTGTKKLKGNIALTGWLRIDSISTLDVSPDNGITSYDITIEEHWYNNIWKKDRSQTGQFIAREGTVYFIGNYSDIYSGDSIDINGNGRANKQFYDLVVSKNDNNYYTRLYPVNVSGVETEGCDLRVLNDFTLESGIFYTYWNDLYVGGDFVNTGGYFQMNEYYNINSTLYLEGTVGNTYDFNPGTSQYFRKLTVNGGGKYLLKNELTINGNNGDNGFITILDGELNLNHNKLNMLSTIGDIFVEDNGKLTLDSASIITMPNLRYLRNKGGAIEIIGNASTPAIVTSTGNFYFIQDSGSFAAKYFAIENTTGKGLELISGTLHATNNLSEGSFNGGIGTAHLTLDGFNLGAGITVSNTFFNTGPTKNVQRLTGTGVITFLDASGTLSGAAYENDGGSLIEWTSPSGKYWDGGGDGISWNDANNWVPDGIPDNTSNVFLDHTHIAGIYTVTASGTDITTDNLSIEAAGNQVSLVLDSVELVVEGDFTIKSGAVFTQTYPVDTLTLKGNWFNAGIYNCNQSPVVFDLLSGTFNFNNPDSIYQFFMRGTSGILYLGSNLNVIDSIALQSSTLTTTNYDIHLAGDWVMDGGIFEPGASDVYFEGNNILVNQSIKGGEFYNLEFLNASPKEITSNISTTHYLYIRNGAFLDGKTSYIFVGERWYNYAGESGFDQTGAGTVVFNGTGASYIGFDLDKTTIFNNLVIQGSGTKYVRDTLKLKANIELQNGTNFYLYPDIEIIGSGTDNTLTMAGGTFYITGKDNFPENFENISIVGGVVDYYSDSNQVIFPTTYYDLRVRRINTGYYTTKTLAGDITLLNSLYVNDTATLLDVNGFEINLTSGIGFPTGGRQIDWNGGTLNHIGASWTIDADISGFNEFVKKGSGWITLQADLDITGNVTFFDETYLNMDRFKLNCSVADKNFEMGAGGILYSYIADTGAMAGPAFPQGFASYSLDETSRTYIRGNVNQEIFTGVEYGTLYLYDNANKTIEINGDLIVRDDFYMSYDGIVLNDNGHDITIGGDYAAFRNYIPTNTIFFNRDGNQQIYADGAYTTLTLNNVDVSGSGTKDFNDTYIDINGNITIHSGATFFSDNNVNFAGATLLNGGVLSHTYNLFTFDGTDQNINPGSPNNFYGVAFSGSGTKTIAGYGLDVYNGLFTIANGVTVDMGSLTHTIASTTVDKTGTGSWITTNANLTFDRNGNQYIDSLTANNLTLATGGYKYLRDDIYVNDVNINSGTRLLAAETTTNTFDIHLTGNWTCAGYFSSYDDTVFFESNNTTQKTIASNSNAFNVVLFNQSQTSLRNYLLSDNFVFNTALTIGNGATLNVNGKTLTVGNNDADYTVAPYLTAGEILTVNSGGHLYVNEGSSLQFDLYDGNPKLDVYGTLSVLGTSGLNANVTWSNGYNTRGAEITVYSGGNVKAEFYHIQYLAPTGFVVQNGATIDNTYNFSNGIWSNIYPGTQFTDQMDRVTVIDTFIYLNIDAEVVLNDIENVTFNHSGTPTVNRHFNVKRNGSLLNDINFSGTSNGLLAGATYEMDPGDLINWPPVSLLTWTGSQNTDWFNANNWSPALVPDDTRKVRIPLVANNPVIYSQGARCAGLEITNGVLGIETGIDSLVVAGNFTIGSNGIFAIEDDAETKVKGDLNIATNGILVAGNGLFTFNAPVGSVVIEPRNAKFNDVKFDGSASFFFEGITNTINGDFNLITGQFIPNDNNYTLTVKGNYYKNGADFALTPNVGIIDFAGTDQTITNGNFSRVKFSNSGTKTLINSFATNYESTTLGTNSFHITDNATALANCVLNLKGNVQIDASATLNDGGLSHTFTGRFWTGTGNYSGTGTLELKGRTQTLYGSKFNNLIISDEVDRDEYKYLLGNVSVTGNCTVNTYSLNADVYTITGTGSFTHTGDSRIYIRGTNNYPSGFASYDAETTTYAIYDGAIDQTIRGAVYGRIRFDGTSTKTLEDGITVKDELYFYDRSVTLTTNNNTINIAGNWYNQYSGTFVPGTGEVIFDGAAAYQTIYLGTSVSNDFYKLTVDKSNTSGIVRPYIRDITIKNELLVHNGQFYTYTGYNTYINGNLIAQNNGTIANAGTYILNKTSGTASLKSNGSTLNNLTITTNGTYDLLDNLTLNGQFYLDKGKFNQNGYVATLGDYLDPVNIEGEYVVGAGGILKLGDQGSFSLKSGGTFKLVGDVTNYAKVTNRTGRYYFNAESGSTIHAQYYTFEYMRSAGIKINNGVTIDATNNFKNGTFSNPNAGGVCLNIENTQEFYGAGTRIENVSFPDNPGSGTVNLKKAESTSGLLEVYNATGLLSGPTYENDPYNLIFWTGDVTLTWTGAISDNWFNASNWSASSGGSMIPDETSTVIIPSGTTNFPKITQDSAVAKSVTINANAFLFVDNPTASYASLVVMSNVQINGTLDISNAEDTLIVYGSWARGTNGNFLAGNGTVIFKGVGSKTINNRNSNFNNLYVDNNGSMQILVNTTVLGDFKLQTGTFDVTTTNYTLTVKGDFIVNGTFTSQSGKVILQGSGAQTLNPGSSAFYDLDILSGNYTLTTQDLLINRKFDLSGGSLEITGLDLYIGDDSGYDDFSISGTLTINDDSFLKVGNNAAVNVYSGGVLQLFGSLNHEAVITHRSTSGRYGLIINSGGEIEADYYKIEYMNSTGLWFKPGSVLDKTTNNLSNGTFANGISGGSYIFFENNYTNDNDTVKITNVYFNSGSTYNAKRVDASTQGIIQFKDAVGVKAGYFFENDDNASSTGGITWKYADPILYWVGGDISGSDLDGTRWDNAANWEDQGGSPGVPSLTTQVFINDVSSGSNKYPVLNAGTDTIAKNITIYSGASLTIGGNKNLNVTGDLIISGNLIVSSGSASIIAIGGQFSNNGNFVHGGASTILWKATNNNTISMNGDSFYNFTLNSGGDGSGTATFSTESALIINGSFSLLAGTVNITNSAHTITIGGNFNNQSTINYGTGKFIFNGSTAQSITASATQSFYNVDLSGAGTKTLNVNINILGNLTNNSTLAGGTYQIGCKGDWGGTGTFSSGTSTVTFNGTLSQRITKAESFYNLIINNTSAVNSLSLSGIVTVNGQLTLTDGIITSSTTKYVYLTSSATLAGGGENCYVSGLMRKAGSSDFVFPIGTSSYYCPMKIESLGSSADFSAQYFDVAPTNRSLLQTGLNSVSNSEYWNLTRNSGTAEPLVSIYWDDISFSGITDVDVLSVAKYNTGISEWESYGAGVVDSLNKFITSATPVSTFGQITFGFEYPTLIWDPTSGSTDFTLATNWTGGSSQTPNSQTNILIPDVTTGDHPVLTTNGQKTYNIYIEDNGILEIANNVELIVEGMFEMEALGELILGSNSTITLLQDFLSYGSITNNTGATIRFTGDIDQNIIFDTCYHVAFNGTEDKILGSNIVVLGNLSIGNSLTAGNRTITVFGNWADAGAFVSGTSTVVLKGTTTQTITESSANGFYNLTVNNTSAALPQITLNANVLVSGALNLTDGVIRSTSTRMLRIGNSGTSINSSDTSYVDGPLYKYGITDFTFPIGKNSILAKLGISGMSGSGNFQAEYYHTPYSNTTSFEAGIYKVTVLEYWDLSRPAGTATPYVTLHWSDSTRSEVSNTTSLLVAHFYSGSWHNHGNAANAANADSSGWVRSSVRLTSFSPVTIGSSDNSNPLPIDLTSFNVTAMDESVALYWSTSSEEKNDYFTIERKNSYGIIETVATVAGSGTTSEQNFYTLIDYNPIRGESYYRLLQTDWDGTTSEAHTWKSVIYQPESVLGEFRFNMYPNPGIIDFVTVELSNLQTNKLTLEVISYTGERLVYDQIQLPGNTFDYSFRVSEYKELSQGVYLIKISDGVTEKTKKIVIQ